jgi:hypothetical protein
MESDEMEKVEKEFSSREEGKKEDSLRLPRASELASEASSLARGKKQRTT